MKSCPQLILLILALLLPACSGSAWHKAFAAPTVTLNYDDFGPESAASKFLGPRGSHTTIIAHYGFKNITPSGPEGVRYVNVLQSMPRTPANEPLRQRLRTTYARLYPLQLKRYNTALSTSFMSPVSGMNRRLILPALPPPEI